MNQTLGTRLSDRIGRKSGDVFARADFQGIGDYAKWLRTATPGPTATTNESPIGNFSWQPAREYITPVFAG